MRLRRFAGQAARSAALIGLLGLHGCAMLDFARDGAGAPVGRAAAPEFKPGKPFVLNSDEQGVVGDLRVIVARDSDTLPRLARQFNLGHDEIVQANPGVDTWLPGEGTQIVLPTTFVLPDAPRQGVVINVAARRLYYYPPVANNEPATVITHPIGIGRDEWPTPTGETTITSKVADPAWYVPQSIRREHAAAGDPLPAVVPPGPDNPLGSHALLLGMPGYLIHGTNKPYGVGMRISHGCIRLYPEDIAPLFELIPVGTPVRIVDQPRVAGWRDGNLFLQAYTPLNDDGFSAEQLRELLATSLQNASSEAALDLERAQAAAQTPRAIPVPVTRGSAGLATLLARAALVERAPEKQAASDRPRQPPIDAALALPAPMPASSSLSQ